jgi:hypothetical protein
VQGPANQQQSNSAGLNQVREASKVVANSRAMQRFETLSGDAEVISNGQANAFFPNVEGENSRGRGGRRIRLTEAVRQLH